TPIRGEFYRGDHSKYPRTPWISMCIQLGVPPLPRGGIYCAVLPKPNTNGYFFPSFPRKEGDTSRGRMILIDLAFDRSAVAQWRDDIDSGCLFNAPSMRGVSVERVLFSPRSSVEPQQWLQVRIGRRRYTY